MRCNLENCEVTALECSVKYAAALPRLAKFQALLILGYCLASKAKYFISDLRYMKYNGNLVRHFIRNYLYEVGTKFDDCGTKFDELGTKYNPEVIKYRPKYTPWRREAPPRGVFS